MQHRRVEIINRRHVLHAAAGDLRLHPLRDRGVRHLERGVARGAAKLLRHLGDRQPEGDTPVHRENAFAFSHGCTLAELGVRDRIC